MKSHRSFTVCCVQKMLVAPFVYELRCEKPSDFKFTPGQFVLFDVPLSEDPTDVQARAYSIASAPSETDLRFVIKLVPSGRASRWIENTLTVGMTFCMQGPFGAFTLDESTDKPYVFVGTGTGIAPLRSQIVWLLQEQGDARHMYLIFGTRQRGDMFWEEMWRQMQEQHPNFHVYLSFLEGRDDRHREPVSVQECLTGILRTVRLPSVYVCGAPITVRELKQQCLLLGIPKSDIHAESYV